MTASLSLPQERHLKVIVFSDVVDSSSQIFADELIAIERIKEDLAMIRQMLQRHGGCLVKSLGDGILATFDAPTQALEFVEEVVTILGRRGHSLQHRFGLHTGEIYVNGDDIIGQGVHLASRLQTTAPANGVAFVQSTFELIDPRFQRRASFKGMVTLKGLPMPISCYTIEAANLLSSTRGSAAEPVDLEGLLASTGYRLERPLSPGTPTSTYLVREINRDRLAVLKRIPCSGTALDALQVEAACLDRLRHPQLPRFVDGFVQSGDFLFVQEYITGASLLGSLDFLRRKQRLADLLRQVLEVLRVIHGAGIVHGDLHPANLIPAGNGGPLFLVDFALVKARSTSGQLTGRGLAGRPFFSPPERARFGSLTPAGDLYALGVIALTLYTGQSPPERYNHEHGCWHLDDLDAEVIDWLAPLLEESPARRLQRATDALRRLDRPEPVATSAIGAGLAVGPLALKGAVRRAVLQRTLAATYGPVVGMLLESSPSTLPPDAVPAVRQRLVAAGLSVQDVDEALLQAVDPQSVTASLPPKPAPPPPAPGVPDPLLLLLRDRIGPIADLLWDDLLRSSLKADPALARQQLLASAVAPETVEELLQAAASAAAAPSPPPPAPTAVPRGDRPQGGSDRSIAISPPEVSAAGPSAAASSPLPPAAPRTTARQTAPPCRDAVLQVIGPIAIPLLEAVAELPIEQQLEQLVQRLRSLGVDAATLADLRRRCDGA